MFYTFIDLIKYFSHFTYFGISAFFGTVGYFIPIPEEVVLVILGYLSGVDKFSFWLVYLFVTIGVVLGDNVFYWLSFKNNRYLSKLTRQVQSDLLIKYENLMSRHIGLTILILRFFIGFRFLGPLVAGSLRVSWFRFFVYDFMVVTGYLGFFLCLGYLFHQRLLTVITFIERSRSFLLSAVVILLIVFILFLQKKNRRSNNQSKDD